jgi:3'-phosphoadenosine 5'-phosphosulfate (PAPS) 3'-phosphatase
MHQKLDEIVSIVLEAGKAIMNLYISDEFTIDAKNDKSPLNNADLVLNQHYFQETFRI